MSPNQTFITFKDNYIKYLEINLLPKKEKMNIMKKLKVITEGEDNSNREISHVLELIF